MSITNKHKNAVLTNILTTPILTAGANETIRITHLVATCTAVNSGTLTLKTIDASNGNLSANLLNAVPFTLGKPIEFFDGFLEPNDSLQGGVTGTPSDPHIVIFYQVETSSILPTEKTLTYTSDGDTNGVCYWIGTNYGASSWTNPHTAGLVTVSLSSVYDEANNNPQQIVDREPSFATASSDTPNCSVILDLGISNKLVCNHYSLRGRSQYGCYPRSWKLQGLNDLSTWDDLDVQTDNTSINTPSGWFSSAVVGSVGYRYLKILQIGVNGSGNNAIGLGEFEFYGTLITTP